jgi:selenocysteine lyase/cysteine desulfurase
MPGEYPSLVAPLMARSAPAYRVRFAGSASVSALIQCMTPNTRAVLVSHVSYLNGERFDLDALRAAADAVGAMLIVDFTQASGYLPIRASSADFAFCASYKWMLGMTGVATAYWNRRRRPDWSPASAGWYSIAGDATDLSDGLALRPDAMRFTRGNPGHMSLYVLSSALDYLAAFEPAVIQAHVQSLTSDLLARLSAHRLESSTPPDTSRHGASVCLARPDAKEIQIRMCDRGVLVWNGRGRLRISFHGYNCRRDVDRVEEALLNALGIAARRERNEPPTHLAT